MTDDQLIARFEVLASRIEVNTARIEKVQASLDTHIAVSAASFEAAKPLIDKINETWDWKNRANGSIGTIKWLLGFCFAGVIADLVTVFLTRPHG